MNTVVTSRIKRTIPSVSPLWSFTQANVSVVVSVVVVVVGVELYPD